MVDATAISVGDLVGTVFKSVEEFCGWRFCRHSFFSFYLSLKGLLGVWVKGVDDCVFDLIGTAIDGHLSL